MLIARAITPVGISYGVVENDSFQLINGLPFDSIELASGGRFPLSEVRLTAPVNPTNFLIMLGGYIRPQEMDNPHMLGDFVQPEGSVRPDVDPLLFTKTVMSPSGPENDVVRPPYLPGPILLEPEIAIVIAKKVRAISLDDAMGAVFGFTIFNDVTAGDFLPGGASGRADFFQAKCADTFASVGPYIRTDLTEEDIDKGLAIEGRINGAVRITGNTRNLKFGISQVVSFASRYRTLYPGDLISLGTPSTPPAVESGDSMEVEIEGIGVLRNRLR